MLIVRHAESDSLGASGALGRKSVSVTHILCKVTASRPTMATSAFIRPRRAAIASPQVLSQEAYLVIKDRDKAVALEFIKKAMKRHGRSAAIVTDGLGSPKSRRR